MSVYVVGIGAGLVSALLFAVVATGSPLALALSFVAPLPIFIAALGWKHRAGLVAAVAGGIAIAFGFAPSTGLAFAIGWAVPAWWLAYLALLGRADADGVEWYPLGRLLLWIAGTAALVTSVGILAIGRGDYGAYRDLLRRVLEGFQRLPSPAPAETVPPSAVIDLIAGLLPFFVASSFAMILTLNLWLAARAVAVSQRLPRPWPLIPATAMPRTALGLLAAAVVAGFLPGFPGAFGLALAGALLIAFALQGLAALHEVTRGRSNRVVILVAAYALAFVLSQVAVPLLALFGLADVAVGLRHRFRPGSAGPAA